MRDCTCCIAPVRCWNSERIEFITGSFVLCWIVGGWALDCFVVSENSSLFSGIQIPFWTFFYWVFRLVTR